MSRPPKRNNPDSLASGGVNDSHASAFKHPYGKESSFIAAIGRGNHDMRRLENRTDVEKIEAMLFKVRASFSFIPFKAHHILCTHFVSIVKPSLLAASAKGQGQLK
jgi:hypothetical protein